MSMNFSTGQILEHCALNNMILSVKGWGVLDGLAVSQRAAGATMGIDVALGNAFINGVTETKAGVTELTIEDAHATLYRKDLITYDASADTPAVVKGGNHAGGEADPIYPPDIPAGDILLAIVDVDAAVTTITNSDINDNRILLPEYNTYSLQAASTVQDTSAASVDVSSAYWSVYKTFTVPDGIVGGSLNVKARLNKGSSTQIWFKITRDSYNASAETYNNGSTADVVLGTFGGWVSGDVIQLSCKNGGSGTAYIDNAEVRCTIVETKLQRAAVTW